MSKGKVNEIKISYKEKNMISKSIVIKSKTDAGKLLFDNWDNKRRVHSTLGYKTINNFETEMYNLNVAAKI